MSKARTMRAAARMQRLFSGDYERPDKDAGPPPADGTVAELLLLPDADPAALNEVALGPESLVVAPKHAGITSSGAAGAEVMPYEGGLGEDEELLLSGGFVLAAQPYTTAAFMPLTCPTAILVTDGQDLEAYLEDADAAVATGAFPDILLHPLTMLGDLCALGTRHPCAAPHRWRAFVGAGGPARPSLGGVPFERADGACACLGGVVEPGALDAARAERPWLSRYLRVVEVLRLIGGRLDRPPAVSGFGARFTETLPAQPVEDHAAPVLLRSGDEHVVCDPCSRRVLRTGADAARILEVVLAEDGGDSVDAVARHLGLRQEVAATAVAEVGRTLESLGFPLRVGEPA